MFDSLMLSASQARTCVASSTQAPCSLRANFRAALVKGGEEHDLCYYHHKMVVDGVITPSPGTAVYVDGQLISSRAETVASRGISPYRRKPNKRGWVR